MYRIYVREVIEAGLKDSDQGRTVNATEVRKKIRVARMEVYWTINAVRHLTNIYKYIAFNSPTYANRTVDRIIILELIIQDKFREYNLI